MVLLLTLKLKSYYSESLYNAVAKELFSLSTTTLFIMKFQITWVPFFGSSKKSNLE